MLPYLMSLLIKCLHLFMFAAISLGSATGAVQAVVNGPQHGVALRAALGFEIVLGDLPYDYTSIAVFFNPCTFTVI